MNFNPFPSIKTKRLFLRKMEIVDAEQVLFLRSNKIVNKYIKRAEDKKTKTLEDAINYIKKTHSFSENNVSVS